MRNKENKHLQIPLKLTVSKENASTECRGIVVYSHQNMTRIMLIKRLLSNDVSLSSLCGTNLFISSLNFYFVH
jgi:hypothetical protein